MVKSTNYQTFNEMFMKKLYNLLFALSFFSFFVNQKSVAQTYASLPFNEQFEGAWVNKNATRDVPSAYWKNTPATTDSSWSRDDDGEARGAWDGLEGEYDPSGTLYSNHSARFHSYATPKKNKGILDLYLNCSGYADAKTLTFWYINRAGSDSLKVYFSTNGGTSYGDALIKLNTSTSSNWTKYTVALGTTTSATCVIRFVGIADYGNSDLGIDNVSVTTPTTPFTVNFLANKVTGMAPVTMQFADASSVDLNAWAWDFENNGSTDATTQYPRHTYTSAGTYSVKFTGTKGASSLATTKNSYITIIPQIYASLPFSEGFENNWINRDSIEDVPSLYFRNQYSNGYESWRRENSYWGGDYEPVGALGTNHSARFNSYNTDKSGYLDVHLDFSTQAGAKTLSFWYINTSGDDSLKVLLSTNGGTSFGNALTVQKISPLWSNIKVDLGNVNSATGVIRFVAYGDEGFTDIGLDQIYIESPSASVVNTEYYSNVHYGMVPFTVDFKDISTGAPTSWEWDFDNNGTVDATAQNASHTYNTPGVYSVKFKASKTGSSETITKDSSIFAGGYASLPFSDNFEGKWITRIDYHDVPSVYAVNNPSTGVNSWSRNDEGVSRGAWGTLSGAYSPAGANGSLHSARFHSYATSLDGVLDYYVNFSTVSGDKILTFWYINEDGEDSLKVYLSTNNGTSFGLINKQGLAEVWTKISVNLGNLTTATGIIRFEALGDWGYSDIGIDEILIDVPIDAQFTANVTSGDSPLEVSFTDQSLGTPTAWAWDFNNDGTVDATTKNPTYTYATPGTYTVKLVASKTGFSDTETKTAYITVSAPLVAAFSASTTGGSAPLIVNFTDQSTFSPTAWEWDFDNDGTVDATTQNPSFTFSTPGTYTVKLVASKTGFTDTETKTAYITVSAPVEAAFAASTTNGSAPLLVDFTDQSTGTPTAWAWDFNNDGTTDATTQNPSFTYSTAGTYTVKLVASKIGSTDTETKTGYITVSPATGIADNDKEVSTEVYPNPASEKVYIRFAQKMEKEKVNIFLLDGNGKMLKVLETESQDLYELDLAGYASGVYFVKVVGKEELLNKKLIIQ